MVLTPSIPTLYPHPGNCLDALWPPIIIYSMAGHDSESLLTTLPGRAQAELELTQAALRGTRQYVVAVLAEGVHLVNEEHGHAAGDRILEELAEQLMAPAGPHREVFR